MGFLNLLSKPDAPLLKLPSGCFTMDREGRVIVGTLSSSFPSELVQQIGRRILETFREAQAAQLPLSELVVRYGSLRICAREMRGGAIVFLSPQTSLSTARQN
jgi:hypothetical protein